MSTKKETQKTAESTAANNKTSQGFTDEEKAAMKERAKELKAEARASKNKAGRGECCTRGDRGDAGTGSQHGSPAS